MTGTLGAGTLSGTTNHTSDTRTQDACYSNETAAFQQQVDDVNNADQNIISDSITGGGLGGEPGEENEGNGNPNNFEDAEVTFGPNEIYCGKFEANNLFQQPASKDFTKKPQSLIKES